MNARPGPPLTTLDISVVLFSYAKLPKMPKMMMPDRSDVNVSNVVTILASLETKKKQVLIMG